MRSLYRNYIYFARRRIFNVRTLWLALGFTSALFAVLSGSARRGALVFLLAYVAFSAYLYLRAQATAGALGIRLKPPMGGGARTATDGETVEIGFELVNRSGFPAGPFTIGDDFPASVLSRVRFPLGGQLRARGKLEGSYRRICNAGMGEYELGPFSVTVGDPLGLFEFRVTAGERRQLRVLPRTQTIDRLPISGGGDSFQYGLNDLPTRGSSVCFIGVREYARGDSLRQIAWRLSARSGRLLVKDFEKSVNTDVTLCLNMCTHEQIGGRAASTWECAKNAALAVLSQQISEGNCVQLLSNGMSIPFGNTREHVELVTRSIFALKPGRPPHDSRELLGWAVARTPPSSTFIYVAPHFSSVGDDTVRQLLALRARNIQVLALLVDPRGFAAEVASGALVHYVHAELARAEQLLKRSVGELEAGGIQTYVIARGQSIGAALVGRRPVEA